MKKLMLACIILLPMLVKAQINDYKATNGVTYHVGDTVRLGKGSSTDGEFMYIQEHGIPQPGSRSHNLPKEFTNGGLIIKRIKTTRMSGLDKCMFIVDAGGVFRFAMFIDDAILACEVTPCGKQVAKQSLSVADELKKLKELLDSGALTQAEFDAQKKKLLNQ